MTRSIFLNLPVSDIAAATRFYEALGCTVNPQFSDEATASMVWAETIVFQLQQRDRFAGYSPRPTADAHEAAQMLIALTCADRAEVDRFVTAAAAAGGGADPRAPTDMGWLYNRTVEDPDGHVFELVWVDPTGMPTGDQA